MPRAAPRNADGMAGSVSGASGFSVIALRRAAYLVVIALVFAGLAWSATWIGDGPASETEQAEAVFAAAVADGQAAPSLIDYSRLDRRLQALIGEPGMVGLAVAVIENGEIRFLKGYGETLAGSGEPVTPDTVFRWASLSKGVAGDMVALLAARGDVSLFAPLSRYSATLRLPAGTENVATVSDLLSHRLGLFAHAEDPKLEDGMDPRWLRASMASLNAICSPGQCHAYQNVAFDAASEIVERVTGVPYSEAVRRELFLPLGMTGASMSRDALMAAPSWARPHVGTRPVEEITLSYYRVPAAGGVNGSIKDLALWTRAQMGADPEVLPPAVLAAVQAPRANTPGENARRRKYRERTPSSAYGLGWRIFDYAGRKVVGHHGGVRGYRSLVLFDPERKIGVAALWNSSSGRPNGIEYEVMDLFYRLPFRDWLGIDEGSAEPAAEPAETAETIPEGN